MKIIAFGASNSSVSINKQLASHAAEVLKAGFVPEAEIEILDLNDFEMPIYSSDRENAGGVPDLAKNFRAKLEGADALIISFAEHNGSYSVAYKNIFDWASRMEGKVYEGKPVVLLSTSPGPGGAGSVLKSAVESMPFFGAEVRGSLSVGSFYDNFDSETGALKNDELAAELRNVLAKLK